MVKRISLARRRHSISRAAFAEHWLGPHAQIARGIPGIRGYLINVVQDPADSEWDGLAETWFESRESAIRAFASEPTRTLLAEDRPKFLERVDILFVSEHVVVAPPKWP
jgi:uncharacterized protein (TIGR02118 family)